MSTTTRLSSWSRLALIFVFTASIFLPGPTLAAPAHPIPALAQQPAGTLGPDIVPPTTTTITTKDITFNANAIVTVTVYCSSIVTFGTITLSVDGKTPISQGSSPVVGDLHRGQTVFVVPGLSAGTHSLHAVTPNQPSSYGSSSDSRSLVVSRATTTTTLAAAASETFLGQSLVLTATVQSSAGVPTGTVTLKDGAAGLITGTLSSGAFQFSTTALAEGSHSLTAAFSATGSYTNSVSSAVVVNITKQPLLFFLPLVVRQ
jgi:hypothetical protein